MTNNLLFFSYQSVKWVKVDGQTFKPGAAIIYDVGSPEKDPKVAIISNIYIVNGRTILFQAKRFEVTRYERKYRAFVIEPCNDESAMFAYNELPLYLPLHPRICRALPHNTIIIMPFYLI